MTTISKRSIGAFAAAVILSGTLLSQTTLQDKNRNLALSHDTAFVTNLVSRYLLSVKNADTTMGSALWAHTSEVSFIYPRGNEYGWKGVKSIYLFFRDNFTERKLTFSKLRFANYGEVLWLEFFWVFDATMKPGNEAVETKGRETQIWKKFNAGWKLVHVHYSGMPVTGAGEGI